MSNKYGFDKIIYVKENTKEFESIYNSASIYLYSSRFEGCSIVLLELQSQFFLIILVILLI